MIRAPFTAVLAAVLVLSAACSRSDDGDPPEPDAPSSSTVAAEAPDVSAVTTKTTIRKVTGRMRPAARAQLRTKIGDTVDEWFEAAFLAGDYPRTDFDDAFGIFTPGARVRATADRKLMSNAAVGTTTFSVQAISRRAKIDVLAERGRAAAVTVKFRIAMTRTGETGVTKDERVLGHLYLTYGAGAGWQVFGYDVKRGEI